MIAWSQSYLSAVANLQGKAWYINVVWTIKLYQIYSIYLSIYLNLSIHPSIHRRYMQYCAVLDQHSICWFSNSIMIITYNNYTKNWFYWLLPRSFVLFSFFKMFCLFYLFYILCTYVVCLCISIRTPDSYALVVELGRTNTVWSCRGVMIV